MPRTKFDVIHDHGIAHVTPEPDGVTYRIEARTSFDGHRDVTVAYASRNIGGFHGRQWESSLPGGGVVNEGQHPTLRAVAQETLDLSYHRANMLKLRIDAGLDKPRTIDMTPTWSGLLPVLLDVYANENAPVQSRKDAEHELRRMARLADQYVALQKRGVSPEEAAALSGTHTTEQHDERS